MEKLIKTFIVTKDNYDLIKNDFLILKRNQAIIPLVHNELLYESEKTRNQYKFEFLKNQINITVKVHEYFSSIQEKFDHIS